MSQGLKTQSSITAKRLIMEKDEKIKELEKEIERLKEEHNKAIQMMKDEIIKKFNTILDNTKKENENYQNQIEELQDKVKLKKMKKKLIEAENEKIKMDYHDLHNKFTTMLEEKIEDNIEDETKALIDQLKEKINSQEKTINELMDENKYVNNENKKMKAITRQIIEQRNETEIYFIEALDEVKRELFIKKKEIAKRGNFFPTLKKNYEKKDMKVDIKNLSPEMKEKILRKLFSKINEGYNPNRYKELNDIMAADISNDNEL